MIMQEQEFKDGSEPRLFWAVTLEQVFAGVYKEIGTFEIKLHRWFEGDITTSLVDGGKNKRWAKKRYEAELNRLARVHDITDNDGNVVLAGGDVSG